MTLPLRRIVLSAVGLILVASVAAGCGGGSHKQAAGTNSVAIRLTDAGCDPVKLSLPAGPTTFTVRNDGADAVSEFELLDGDRILGEAENLPPGLEGGFSLTLSAGSYTTYCPGGTTAERGTLVVRSAGTAGSSSRPAAVAVGRYRKYVEHQVALLVAGTQTFTAALDRGDLAAAKRLYGPARTPYERVEPVAESFDGLDPAIDARAGDVPEKSWTGFHPIERLLWVKGTTRGTAALGRTLLHDVRTLQRRVEHIELEPAQIANGAVELLGEVSKSKITGEEERYSHIDLVDFEANVDGARAAFDAVRPLLEQQDSALAATVARRFGDVETALGRYRRGNGFVSYRELQSADTRRLSQAIDALAEPLSGVAARVVTG